MNTNRFTSVFLAAALAIALVAIAPPALAQQNTMGQTTVATAIGTNDKVIYVASATGINAPSQNQIQTVLVIDREAMEVTAVSGTAITVNRGKAGTRNHAHNVSAVVWVGQPAWIYGDSNGRPAGACVAANQTVLPRVYTPSGDVVDCVAAGPGAQSIWVTKYAGQANGFADGAFWVPPSACYPSVSGNSTGTNGLTVSGASSTPVVQASTSASGTNTHTYVCSITVPSRLVAGRGILVTDATFFYGVQTTNLGTQAATLASGTMNSSIVLSKIAYPAAGASETPSTVTPVRADSGSLTITPAVASFNTGTTTAGSFYSVKFAPASPIALNTDLQQILLTVTLQCAATSATVTNSPGLLVHYTSVPL